MNRKKKINQTLKAKAKKANAKKAGIPANKPKYIAKADRLAVIEPEMIPVIQSGSQQTDLSAD
jgi:hypothetical protein